MIDQFYTAAMKRRVHMGRGRCFHRASAADVNAAPPLAVSSATSARALPTKAEGRKWTVAAKSDQEC